MKYISLLFLVSFFLHLAPIAVYAQAGEDTLTVDEIDNILSPPDPLKGEEPPNPLEEVQENETESEKSVKSDESAVMMSFVKYKAPQSPDSLYFNILKIVNNLEERLTGAVSISVPDGWKLISPSNNKVRIDPGKSTYLPVRVALSRDAKGGVGYVINASMLYKPEMQSQNSEKLLRTECYVSVPKISKWKINTTKRVVYFNREVEYEKFELYFENTGNAEELIKLEFKIGEALTMYGAEGNTYLNTLSLRPNSDTVVSFSVKHIPIEDDISTDGWRGTSINIKASGGEKTEATSVWFRYLESSFTNKMNKLLSPLIIEATARNLLSEFKPGLNLGAYGTVLLQKNRDIDYYLHVNDIAYYGDKNGSEYSSTLWRQSRMLANYNTKNARISLGDMGGGLEHAIYGRGIGGSYTFKNNTISAVAVRNVYQPINGAAIKHEIRLKRGVSIQSGLNYENDDYNKINSASGAVGGSFSFLKAHRLSALFGISTTRHLYNDSTFKLTDTTFVKTDDPDTTLNGFGYNLNYGSKIGKFQFSLTNRFGSRNHTGIYKGRFDMMGDVWYHINKKHRVFFRYLRYSYNPALYRQGLLLPENSYIREIYSLQFVTMLNPKLTMYAGPQVENLSQKRFDYIGDTVVPLSTVSPQLSMRLTYRNGRYNTISPYLIMGYTKVIESADSAYGVSFSEIDILRDKPFYNARAGVNVRSRYWGVNAYYYYGPYTIYDQSAYLYGGNFHKSIRILPYFEKYFINKNFKLSSYNSYFYDAAWNTERINLNARLEFFFNKGWTLLINNNIFLYNRYSDELGKLSNRTYYMDIGFKKIFDIPQPRVKYYDLKVIFYKDLNGNRVKDENEGGLDYILVKIERDEPDTLGRPSVPFSYIELISDQSGEINYYNIPEGNYKITILPLRNIKDLYNINGEEQRILIKNNTTHYVPFVQANKVRGKIVLIRDEFSSEGAISVADIRITATDSAAKTYSTLTDKQGEFSLFVPQTGRTTVRVNNVFGENFEILQDEFTVDFNGFKEFEIVFKFKEKSRGINIRGGEIPPGKSFIDRDVDVESPAPPEKSPSPAEPSPGTGTTPETGSQTPQPSAPSITWEETNNYIVLGSFTKRDNAQQFLDDLTPKDNAMIITTPKGMFRVVYGYRTEKEARDDLEKRKSVFPAAWISKKQ